MKNSPIALITSRLEDGDVVFAIQVSRLDGNRQYSFEGVCLSEHIYHDLSTARKAGRVVQEKAGCPCRILELLCRNSILVTQSAWDVSAA